MNKTILAVVASAAILVTSITAAYAVKVPASPEKAQAAEEAYEAFQRRMQTGKCAEGYTASQNKVDGKNLVYECVKILRCAGEFRPKEFEVVDAGSSIIQRYQCSMRDKAQLINLPAE